MLIAGVKVLYSFDPVQVRTLGHVGASFNIDLIEFIAHFAYFAKLSQ